MPDDRPTPETARAEAAGTPWPPPAPDAGGRHEGTTASLAGNFALETLDSHGRVIGDFELLGLLGEGATGKVYLARQVSLDRQVALKVTANLGHEGRTMASLEHDNIVRVFSETVDSRTDRRLLCMQYVPGTTLERIICELRSIDRGTWSGQRILDIIDSLNSQPTLLDPHALRDREVLAGSDFFAATCWVGARLAEALDYAHRQGVLHRDIKPANILLNQYGRPLLADFSVSSHTSRVRGASRGLLGGTFPFMAPEHLEAFAQEAGAPPAVVDERSDVYSLGVVLFELVAGRRPFERTLGRGDAAPALAAMAAERRRAAPSLRDARADAPLLLERVVRRTLAPRPEGRFPCGADLARALDGARELWRVDRELPPAGWLGRRAARRPFRWVVLLALLPHVAGSAVNIAYNGLRLTGELTPEQERVFLHLVLAYNAVVYPLCLFGAARLLLPLLRAWRRYTSLREDLDEEIDLARRRLLTLPLWVVGLSSAGWLPGGILFPLGIHLAAGPIAPETFVHFFLSFTLSGMIALTYAFFGVQYVVVRVLYPQLLGAARAPRETAARELSGTGRRVGFFQVLSGLIPLAGAATLVVVGPEGPTVTFRALILALIALGMGGFCLAVAAASRITRVVNVLAGMERPGGASSL